MVTPLERAIDALSDGSVPLPDALRTLLVVARRIGAVELVGWLSHELNGYKLTDEIPTYRSAEGMPIALHFEGPFQASVTRTFSQLEMPAALRPAVGNIALHEALASCIALAEGDGDPELVLPMVWVDAYRRLAEQGEAITMQMMTLNHAAIRYPRTHVRGVLDRVRTHALQLALSLEEASPSVGQLDGPRVDTDAGLAAVVHVAVVNIYGDGANVAVGQAAQAIQVMPGDVEGLLRAAASYLKPDGVQGLDEAIKADGGQPGEATKSFLQKVKSGAFGLVGGIAGNGAYDAVLALIGMAFPDVMG